MSKKAPSSNNPEARLQAACAADQKVAILSQHIRSQELAVSVARWEIQSTQKGDLAARKRRSEGKVNL